MTKAEIVKLLSGVPLFAGCSKRELGAIAGSMKEIRRSPESILARQGDPGVGFFLITSGTATVKANGRTRAKLGSGDFFGEISLLDGGPRSATVQADTAIEMLGLTGWSFRGVIEHYPSIAQKMLVVMAERLRAGTPPGIRS